MHLPIHYLPPQKARGGGADNPSTQERLAQLSKALADLALVVQELKRDVDAGSQSASSASVVSTSPTENSTAQAASEPAQKKAKRAAAAPQIQAQQQQPAESSGSL